MQSMHDIRTLIEVWDEAHRELMISLGGVETDDLWVRPHERLLSIGEIAGHVAYWETERCFAKDSVPFESSLIDDRFRYYTGSVGETVVLDVSAEEVRKELEAIHAAAKASVEALNPGPEELVAWLPGDWWNWYGNLQYMGFHVAYHTGQIYSARHILGHETEDN